MLRCYLKSGRHFSPLPITGNGAAWDSAAQLGRQAGSGWEKLSGIELAK